MPVIVAEYLGVRTDKNYPLNRTLISKKTNPPSKPTIACPFKDSHCEKAKRGDKPVCSLRDAATGELWIVCPSRLCATTKGTQRAPIALNEYQKLVLHDVAKEVFDSNISRSDVLVDREVPIKITENSDYSADYIMWRNNPNHTAVGMQDRPIVLEMQGGGETTDTGHLTSYITEWMNGTTPSLTLPVTQTSPLVTNAWRRQQEQFLVKGNSAMLTGGRIAFVIGSMIHNYLMPRLTSTTIFPNLKNANWTLALIPIIEDKSPNPVARPLCAPFSIPLAIDSDKVLFTNYSFFVQAITNQGTAHPAMFNRTFQNLI
jgi:hypothetical protein